jgi:DNA-binding response OmpR family regulator
MKTKILIVEDDVDLGHLLGQYLDMNGFEARRVYNGDEALEELKINSYDLLILDVMMPKEDGFSLAEKLTSYYPEIPFLFVTAKKMKADILHGLQLGADDYIVKPFDADELILRLRNILKRVKRNGKDITGRIAIGKYWYDHKNLKLSSPDNVRILTDKEAQLLKYLCTHQDQLIKREEILTFLWKEPDFFSGRSMDVFISRLRKYLADDPAVHLESVRGMGYQFYIDGPPKYRS